MNRVVTLLVITACSGPPAPAAPVENHVRADPPIDAAPGLRGIDARIVKIEVMGADRFLTVDRGSDSGIDSHWTVKVISGDQTMAPATLIRIDKQTSVIKAEGPAMRVRFEPPDAGGKLL